MDEPLIYRPTKLSQHFSKWVSKESHLYEKKIRGSFFTRVQLHCSLMIYKRHKFREVYYSLCKFDLPELADDRRGKLQQLELLFKEVQSTLMINNLALAKLSQHEELHVLAKTIENERIEALARVAADGESACHNFKHRFGHYALNAYELAEPRFSEYVCDQLVALANPLKKLAFNLDKPTMSDYFNSTTGSASITHLIGIRELGKSCALQVVAALRSELNDIDTTDSLAKTIYEYDWDKLLSVI
jgi:hypothetical protein